MPDSFSQNSRFPRQAEAGDSLPEVQIEVRQGKKQPATYALTHVDFLIGTVPGCDLRLPGTDLPAVLCLLARHGRGVCLRKLAPGQPIQVNGKPATLAELADGDRIGLGPVELVVHLADSALGPAPGRKFDQVLHNPSVSAAELEFARQELREQVAQFHAQVFHFQEEKRAFDSEKVKQAREWKERLAQFEVKQKRLQDQAATLETERALWTERKEEMRRELAEVKKTLVQKVYRARKAPDPEEDVFGDLGQSGLVRAEKERKLARQQEDLDVRAAHLEEQKRELDQKRRELDALRKQWQESYQERWRRLAELKEGLDQAARKVQEGKEQLEVEVEELARKRQEESILQADLENRAGQLAYRVQELEEENRKLLESQADMKVREEQLRAQTEELEKSQKQHQADLVRLDRLQGTVEEREREVRRQEEALEKKTIQLQETGAALEAEVLRIEEWRAHLEEEKQQFKRQKEEQEAQARQLAQRATALEGQQATLAALRTRLERQREDIRQQEMHLAEERDRQEAARTELHKCIQEASQRGVELDSEKQFREKERLDWAERNALLQAALEQLHQAQERLAAEEQRILQKDRDLEEKTAALAQRESALSDQAMQLQEATHRLGVERQALRERTLALTEEEQARGSLQEQLRKRAEELAQRQKQLEEHLSQHQEHMAALERERAEIDRQQQEAQRLRAGFQKDFQDRAVALDREKTQLEERARELQQKFEKIKEMGQAVARQRKDLAQERSQTLDAQNQSTRTHAQQRAEFELLRREAGELLTQFPDLELRTATALERLAHARALVRDHLAEVHAYIRQCQEDLENLRARLQNEVDRLVQQEQALNQRQEEHRLGVAAFRQQLLEWQGNIAELKRLLAQDETRLERRQAQVAEQARQIDETSQQLARQTEELQVQKRQIDDRRQEVDRHLVDMREWYRKKLRELAGIDESGAPNAVNEAALLRRDGEQSKERSMAASSTTPDTFLQHLAETQNAEADQDSGIIPIKRDILSITGDVDPKDRKLGNLLQELELVDRDSLTALLVEARRQRRSLRQVLLAGGVVTLYQLSQIEEGNVDGLVLGPVRIIDRLRQGPQETVYRVFDPRRGQEAVLRHLSEAEMQDAVHPDEFRQRFTQAMVADPYLAATWEVMEIAGRPAVLQEWLTGLPSGDWPPLVAVPGVCYRLLLQAAQGLAAAHAACLYHGHLHEDLILLTGEGVLKICGLGEPPWLWADQESRARGRESGTQSQESNGEKDLKDLGKIVAGWCSPVGVRKGAKAKPLPEALVSILYRLATQPSSSGEAGSARGEGYASAAELLEDLEKASALVPANPEAWDRLLRHVKEHATPEAALRKSA